MMKRAVFLDRDGTLIKDCHYLKDPTGIELLPNAAEGLKELKDCGFLLIIVSNQSGVARGYFTIKEMEEVNRRLLFMLLEQGVEIDKLYCCPHHSKGIEDSPFTKECACRKPQIGMAMQAQEELQLNLASCYMIGDKPDDILFGKNFGAKASILIKGEKNSENKPEDGISYDYLAEDLLESALWIKQKEKDQNDENRN